MFSTKVKLKSLAISVGVFCYPEILWAVLTSKPNQSLNFIEISEVLGYFDCHLIVFTNREEGNKW